MGEISCVVCVRRVPERGFVCELDIKRITEQLHDLPRKMAALVMALVPAGTGPGGERVSVSRTGSPTPARLDALSLIGPGTGHVSVAALAGMLHPKIHKWRTVNQVTVTTDVAGRKVVQERQVTTWHQELARREDGRPHLVLHDDQIGLVPPAPWLRLWARRWQRHLGHPHRRSASRTTADAAAALRHHDDAVERQRAAQALLALHGQAPFRLGNDDPLAEHWEILFGTPVRAEAPLDDLEYLLTWLEQACLADLQISTFATELRALSEEMTRVLGERPDQQWLGRCPAQLADRDTGIIRPCGAGLWQDPFASQVVCPRCRSAWGPARVDLLKLASSIRKIWPVDRRRRYTTVETDILNTTRPLRCPGCTLRVNITWREVTARGEQHRFWRPDKAVCPAGCVEAARLI